MFDRDTILALLSELGARLHRRGHALEIYVVGGTAMVLAYDRDRLTRDIDAVWSGDGPLTEVARRWRRRVAWTENGSTTAFDPCCRASPTTRAQRAWFFLV